MNVKESLTLAYKIINYVFDSEISQTAVAKEHKYSERLGRSGKSPLKRILELNIPYSNNSRGWRCSFVSKMLSRHT